RETPLSSQEREQTDAVEPRQGVAACMCEAPAFHQGPRPFLADCHACCRVTPARISFCARVKGRLHCRHSSARSRRRIQPSSSSNTPRSCVSRKYDTQPRYRVELVEDLSQALATRVVQRLEYFRRETLTTRRRDFQLRFLVPRHTVAQKLPLPRGGPLRSGSH